MVMILNKILMVMAMGLVCKVGVGTLLPERLEVVIYGF